MVKVAFGNVRDWEALMARAFLDARAVVLMVMGQKILGLLEETGTRHYLVAIKRGTELFSKKVMKHHSLMCLWPRHFAELISS